MEEIAWFFLPLDAIIKSASKNDNVNIREGYGWKFISWVIWVNLPEGKSFHREISFQSLQPKLKQQNYWKCNM